MSSGHLHRPPHLRVTRLDGLSRRRFLTVSAGAVVLGACGSDGDDTSSSSTSVAAGDDGPSTTANFEEVVLLQIFGPGQHETGRPQRFPLALGDTNAAILADVPAELDFQVRFEDETVDELTIAAAGDGLPRRFYPVTFTPETAGAYTIVANLNGRLVEANVLVEDAGTVNMLRPGDAMPSVATPTTEDPAGVMPICTRSPACEFHAASLPDLLGAGPVALLISTPAFCTTTVCGPILDLLIDEAPNHADLSFVHAEVYADTTDGLQPGAALAPIVNELGLTFEPSLLLLDADGALVDRLDNIFGAEEISALLSKA